LAITEPDDSNLVTDTTFNESDDKIYLMS